MRPVASYQTVKSRPCKSEQVSTFSSAKNLRVSPASQGDRFSIFQLMQRAMMKPSEADLLWQLERPGYTPAEHLICRYGQELVGHVHLVPRKVHWGSTNIDAFYVEHFATASEYSDLDIPQALLTAIDARIERSNATLAITRTNSPEPFLQRGWTGLGESYVSKAPVIDILTALNAPVDTGPIVSLSPVKKRKISVRLWRQVETDALRNLYEKCLDNSYGSTARSDEHWQWLLNRRAFDRIYIAIDGGNKLALDGDMSRILGYAVVSENSILEMMTVNDDRRPAEILMSRICSDALENDQSHIQFQAEPEHELHQVLRNCQIGSSVLGGNRGNIQRSHLLVRAGNPIQFLAEMAPSLHQIAAQNLVEFPCELGLEIDGEKYCLHFEKNRISLTDDKLGRSFLRLSSRTLMRILLGDLDFSSAIESGQVFASNQVATNLVSKIPTKKPIWFTQWDDLANR
ncbi:MAG: GNAT family N-acetyltransferase [Pirellulales bacterium]